MTDLEHAVEEALACPHMDVRMSVDIVKRSGAICPSCSAALRSALAAPEAGPLCSARDDDHTCTLRAGHDAHEDAGTHHRWGPPTTAGHCGGCPDRLRVCGMRVRLAPSMAPSAFNIVADNAGPPCPGIPQAPADGEDCPRCEIYKRDRDAVMGGYEAVKADNERLRTQAPAVDVPAWLRDLAHQMRLRGDDNRANGCDEAASAWERERPGPPEAPAARERSGTLPSALVVCSVEPCVEPATLGLCDKHYEGVMTIPEGQRVQPLSPANPPEPGPSLGALMGLLIEVVASRGVNLLHGGDHPWGAGVTCPKECLVWRIREATSA